MKYLIFFVSLFVFFIGTIFEPLRNWDEAWYAEIIKNMVSGQHSFLVPFWQGQYYFDKPPLYFWLSLPIVHLFGMGEWQVRLISVIASAFCALLVYLIAQRLFDRKVGLLSVLAFVSLGQVFIRFSHGNLDALLVCLFLATYYFWLTGGRFVYLSGIALGLGFLVKGWTLGLFPLFLIGFHSWVIDRRFVPKGSLYIIVGSVLASSWWYILGSLQFGQSFYNWYLLTPGEGNFTASNFSIESLKYLVRDIGIWWIVWLWVVVRGLWGTREEKIKVGIFLFCAFCFLLLLFFSQEPADWHNLPVYPFVAIIVGWGIFNLHKKHGKRILVTCCLLLVTQVFVVYKIENIYPDRSRIGAELGYMMTVVKQERDIVVLDDHDFTSFLYYSNMGKVYVASQDGGKSGEFWTLKYSDLPEFIKTHEHTVLISRDIEKIYVDAKNGQVMASGMGYSFVRLVP